MPLNDGLYNLLVRKFGKVKIANRGQTATKTYVHKLDRVMVDVKGGERYCVNDPDCNDTRYRLWFSYLYNTYDNVTASKLSHLIWCYNCERDFKDFYELELSPLTSRFSNSVNFVPEVSEYEEPPEILLPSNLVSLSDLPENHRARNYLAGRNFDPDTLTKFWCVKFCENSDTYTANNRLVFPMLVNGKLLGWQARTVIKDVMPKMYSARGMLRNSIVYNIDMACDKHVCIITEGPLSAIRVGDHAVALLGKTMSDNQLRLIGNKFRNKHVVIMTDPDAAGKAGGDRIFNRMNNTVFASVTRIHLTKGDPADHTHNELIELINEHLKENNIDEIDSGINPDLL